MFVDLENSKDWGEIYKFANKSNNASLFEYIGFLVSGYGLLYIEMILERLAKFYKT